MTEPEKPKKPHGEAAGRVAIILAAGMAVAINLLTAALLYAAIVRLGIDPDSGLSPQGAQVLLAWGGGIISVLAGYVGYIVGKKDGQNGGMLPKTPPPQPSEPPKAP